MSSTMRGAESSKRSLSLGWIASLLLVIVVMATLWPTFRMALFSGMSSITRPFLAFTQKLAPDRVPLTTERKRKVLRSSPKKMAEQARSMEFRIQRYRIDSTRLQEWCAEWECDSTQKLLLLRLLLRQLPEAFAKETPNSQRLDLVQSILDLANAERREHPQNGFYWVAEALALFYSAQDSAAILAIQQAGRSPQFDVGLKELNYSEYALWEGDSKPWILLPTTPRIWGLDLERPIHALSRGLALQQRTLLRKYNIEKGMEIGMTHLGLAVQLAEAAWTPADYAMARAMARRAIEPFWTDGSIDPTFEQLEKHFIQFLEDQGDSLASAKARNWFQVLSEKEITHSEKLPLWRQVQLMTIWNASTVLGNLIFQTVSILLAWGTVLYFLRNSTPLLNPAQSSWRQRISTLVFVISPLAWTISAWPTSGTYMLVGLFLSWVLWWVIISFRTEVSLEYVGRLLSRTAITLLTLTLWITIAVAFVLDYRQRHLSAFLKGN